MTEEILYGRTPLGQLIYDLAFARLRKHKMPVGEVRKARAAALRGLRESKARSAPERPGDAGSGP